MRKLLLIPALALLVGCGGDDGTGISSDDGTGISSMADVNGRWTYTSVVSGFGVSCNINGADLSFSQLDSSFIGTYAVLLSCVFEGQTFGASARGSVASGQVTESGSVSFNFDNSNIPHTGSISGDSMSGTVSVRLASGCLSNIYTITLCDADLGVVTLTGNWTASR